MKPTNGNVVQKASEQELINLRARWSTELGLGKNPVAQFGAPVSFTSNLASITPGQGPVPLSTSALANGFRMPYVIDEIRMQAYMTTPSATILLPSYALKFQFRTGLHAFSPHPVSMFLHQPLFVNPGFTLLSSFAGGLVRYGDEARWLLPKPLWMAPGDQIQCNVTRLLTPASSGNGAFTVDVTYVGRTMKPGTKGPRTRCVPWISQFTHDFDDSFSQSNNEFRNQFQVPLQVQRLVGKTASKATSGLFTFNTAMLPAVGGTQYAALYMVDSLGYKITRDFTASGTIFDTSRCAWTFSRPIGPTEKLDVQIRTVGSGDVENRLFTMAMIGYREEDL